MTYMSVTRKPDCAGLRNLDTTKFRSQFYHLPHVGLRANYFISNGNISTIYFMVLQGINETYL